MSTDSVYESFELFMKLKTRFAEAKFIFHKFLSSSSELMYKIAQQEKQPTKMSAKNSKQISEDLSYAKLTVNTTETQPDSSSNGISKVLGHCWNCKSDVLEFNFDKLADYAKPLEPLTKRNILRVKAKLVELLGILSPVIIKNNFFFQKLAKKNWDETIDENIQMD